MIRACFIIKYPPIQGGVSATSYWMTRALAERGHQIFVVTNANEVEDDYRIYMDEDDREWYETRSATGGFARVCRTQASSIALSHIPQANPFVTKLSSIATQTIRRHDCEVLFAFYLQPYGLAAHLAAHWTGVPYIIRHAGSDLGRLMRQPGLTTAYREVIKAADSVWTGPTMKNTFLALGVPEDRIWHGPGPQLPTLFNPEHPPLDVNGLLRRLARSKSAHVRGVLTNTSPIDLSKPTIGIYGKVGEVKGSFDLLRALASLKRERLDFNFVALTQGTFLPGFKQLVHELDLHERTWILPFIPHWKIPGFIRACTAVCFLERDFPISFHTPTIPREVMACGTCLLLSGEIVEKQARMRKKLSDGENIVIVDDPRDHADLARQLAVVINDPVRAGRIGLAGHDLSVESERARDRDTSQTSIDLIEQQLEKVARRTRPEAVAVAGGQQADDTRKQRLRSKLPWTSARLQESWTGLVDRYCEMHPIAPENPFDEAVNFCDYLDDTSCVQDDAELRELVRYERQHNLLFLDRDDAFLAEAARVVTPAYAGDDGGRRGPKTVVVGKRKLLELQRRSFDELLRLRPMTAPGVRVEVFSRDLRTVARSLRRDETAPDRPDARTIILFKKELNFVGLELKINEATKFFLDLCDGSRTLQATIAEMDSFYQRTNGHTSKEIDMTDEVLHVLQELTGKEIVHLLAAH
jgi:glycosyltransferase involved in cell wall biosynthesis